MIQVTITTNSGWQRKFSQNTFTQKFRENLCECDDNIKQNKNTQEHKDEDVRMRIFKSIFKNISCKFKFTYIIV